MYCEGYGELGMRRNGGAWCRSSLFLKSLELPHSNIFQKLFNFNIHNTNITPQSLFHFNNTDKLIKTLICLHLFVYLYFGH